MPSRAYRDAFSCNTRRARAGRLDKEDEVIVFLGEPLAVGTQMVLVSPSPY